jgi:hypothetical protein
VKDAKEKRCGLWVKDAKEKRCGIYETAIRPGSLLV